MNLEKIIAEHSILISGASRGIGLEFGRQFCEMGWHVIATCRNPEHAAELAKLSGAALVVSQPMAIFCSYQIGHARKAGQSSNARPFDGPLR
jgi:NAD(P)-dependent dehydrogenase (short-subunit alcohol dehydrogenase family)